jgi:hypothetical protein
VLLTSAEQLVGVWQGLGPFGDAFAWRFSEDGTCYGALLLSSLDSAPNITCTYRFEGTTLFMTVVATKGVPSCRTAEASYKVQVMGHDKIYFIVVKDNCVPRITTMAMDHQRVP